MPVPCVSGQGVKGVTTTSAVLFCRPIARARAASCRAEARSLESGDTVALRPTTYRGAVLLPARGQECYAPSRIFRYTAASLCIPSSIVGSSELE
jgi:hypothetical protein